MLIAISGKARAGKDTFADFLIEAFSTKYNTLYKKFAYAGVLKNKLMAEFDLSYDQLYGDKKEWADLRYPKDNAGVSSNPADYWTPREIMQFIGTDCYRAVDNDFWVKALFKNIDTNNAIIADCRFKSEIDAVVYRSGYHVKIVREDKDEVHGENHISETELNDDYNVDILCLNDYSLEKLKEVAYDTVELLMNLHSNKKGVI